MTNKNGYALDWSTLRRDWPIWLVMAGAFLVGVLVYPHLADQAPIHWNVYGQPDNFAHKSLAVFLFPLTTVGLYGLLLVVPLLDPRRDNYARFAGVYRLLRSGMVLIFTGIYLATLAAGLGYQFDIGMMVKGLVALLFILIGNMMGQVRHNYFVGIKVPWTLASEEVWRKTHRLAGRMWVVGGIICLVTAFVPGVFGAVVFFGAVLVMTVVPMVYSYIIYRQLHG